MENPNDTQPKDPNLSIQNPTDPTLLDSNLYKVKKPFPWKIVLSIIGLLLLGVALAGIVYRDDVIKLVAKPIPTPTIIPSPTPTSAPLQTFIHEPVARWITYTNSEYGFSFKYPSNLYGSDYSVSNKSGLYFVFTNTDCINSGGAYCSSIDSISLEIVPTNTGYEEWKINNLMKKSVFSEDGIWIEDGEECYKQSKQEKVLFNGIEAESFSFSWNQLGHPYKCRADTAFNLYDTTGIVQDIYFFKENNIYNLSLRYIYNSKLHATFKEMLQSFKFTESTPSASVTSPTASNSAL